MSKIVFPAVGLLSLLLLGCAAHNETPAPSKEPTDVGQLKLDQLTVSQAINDARNAVAQKQFKLLAFTNRTISFPGIDMQLNTLEWVDARCGIIYLPGTGDTLKIGEDTQRRKALHQYASSYNPIVLDACQKAAKESNN